MNPQPTLQQLLLDTIAETQSLKRHSGIYPDSVSLTDIQDSLLIDIRRTLNDLVSDGRLSWHKTVNGIPMFGIKEQKQ